MSLQSLSTKLPQSLCSAVLAVAAFGAGTQVFAQSRGFVAVEEPATGRIVPIAPGGAGSVLLEDATDDAPQATPPQVEPPKHWIGILLGPVTDEVRAQVDLPEDQGVAVRQVVPASPAAKAGLERFDIVLSANEKPVVDGRDLMALVQQEGDSGGKLTLDVLRRGEHHSIAITPEVRPEPKVDSATGGQSWGSGAAMPGMPNFGPDAMAPHLRMRVPRSAFGQALSLNQMPNGVSVNIQKQNDGPTHITVKRGNDTWEIVGDDPKSLEQLPDDVRPFVERLLANNEAMQLQMPGLNRMRGVDRMPGMWGPTGFDNDAMQQQLHRMEQQLQQMRQQLEHDIQQQRQLVVPLDRDDAESAPESDAN